MAAPEHYPKHGQKRSQSAVDEAQCVQPLQKTARKQSFSIQEDNARFWDSLSRVHLTRNALEELNRRNRFRTYRRKTAATSGPKDSHDFKTQTPLTSHLKHSARHGGPDLTDLRGFPEPSKARSTAHAMPPSHSTSGAPTKSTNTLGNSIAKPSNDTVKTNKTSPYDLNFEQHLIDHGIYPARYSHLDGRISQKPQNQKEILETLARSRPSLSLSHFPDSAFEEFVQINDTASSKDDVMQTAYPMVVGTTKTPLRGGKFLTNWAPLTDGTLTIPKPDAYDGAKPAQIDQLIREKLGSHVIPSTQSHCPALANFFTTAKGPNGSAAAAKRKACYDGVLGARGMHSLQNFGVDPSKVMYDDNAYTITSTYHDGTLKLYTTHPTKPRDSNASPEYHMTQLRSFALTDTAETFRAGASAFRNARDWAKEQRDKFITTANAKVVGTQEPSSALFGHNQLSLPTQGAGLQESEICVDEVSLGWNDPAKHPKQGREMSSSEPDPGGVLPQLFLVNCET